MKLGDIVRGIEIGKKGKGRRYIRSACAICEVDRWVELRNGKPRTKMCTSCTGLKQAGNLNHHIPDSEKIVAPHAHFWVIDSPNGEKSRARCKICGARQTFANSFPDDKTTKQVVIEPRSNMVWNKTRQRTYG